MLRSGASRSILRSLNSASNPAFKATSSPFKQQFSAQLWTATRRPQTLVTAIKPLSLVRAYAETRQNVNSPDLEREKQYGNQKLEANPAQVTLESSTHPIMNEVGQDEKPEDQAEMMAGIYSDMKTIKETFSLENVPREAYYIGMAGVLPYLATSLSTVYCAWEINHSAQHGAGFLLSERTAELSLHILEPLQVGYGATIISFLGAIHWGLEFAGYGGHHGYSRYRIGVIGAAVAWPTILLPVEYALISQFLIFNFMYYTDSRAAKRGWAPAWYGVYRFVLTFFVGSAIVISLIGRGQIVDRIGRVPGPTDKVRELRQQATQYVEEEEAARRKFLVQKDEEDEEDEDEESDDDE